MTKLELISELSDQTEKEAIRTQENWTAYLRTGAQVYKYPFSDQLLIHAQRPDAAACASIQFWNNRMKRWVNRGAKGIALLDDSGKKVRLKYVFDVSDTRPLPGVPEPYFWQMQPEYEKPVMEAIANSFGDLSPETADFRDFLYAAASIAVQDHLEDYLNNYEEARAGTLLEELDYDAAAVFLKDAVTNSVAYAAMVRCGLDADGYLHGDEFTTVCQHNSPAATLHIGTAVSDITRVVLAHIERTVKNIEQQKLFDLREKFAKPVLPAYHKGNEEPNQQMDERRNEDGDYVFASGGLSPPEPDPSGAAGRGDRQVRQAAQDVPQAAQAGAVQRAAVERQAGRTPRGDRPDSTPAGRADDAGTAENESRAGQNGRSDGLGTAPERDQSAGGGNRNGNLDLQLETEPQAEDELPPSAFVCAPGERTF